MQKTRLMSLILSVICAAGIFGGEVRAQNPAGEIRGQVTDEHGGAIVGAKITLVSRDGAVKAGLTDQQGVYSFKSLAAGAYTLRVAAKGFAVYENADVPISTGHRAVQDVQLKIGTV